MRYILFVFSIFILFISKGGVLTVIGEYKGQNIFIQNTFDPTTKEFCVVSVYVNEEEKLRDPVSTAVEVDLAGFEMDQKIEIKIVYRKGCKPKIINPQALEDGAFAFKQITLTKEKITFITRGEKLGNKVIIEQYEGNVWVQMIKLDSKGSMSENVYELKIQHHSGLNKYRLVYFDENNKDHYSHEYYFHSSQVPVSFYPEKVEDLIYFHSDHPVYYRITNKNGEIVSEGIGKTIDCSKLENNESFDIYFDNQYGKFKVHHKKH